MNWNPYTDSFPLPELTRMPSLEHYGTDRWLEWEAKEEQRTKAIIAFGLNRNPKAISVRHENGYKVAHQEPSTGCWRVTSFDLDGFPNGHDMRESQADAYYTALSNGLAFEDVPCAPFEEGTKDEIIERLRNNKQREFDVTTLLLFFRMPHNLIWKLID